MLALKLPLRLLFCSSFIFICSVFFPHIAHSNTNTNTNTKTIHYHPGGGVTSVYIDVIRADNNGTQVRIAGNCLSACTLYLASDKVCVSKAASFKFHQAQFGSDPRYKSRPNIKGTQFLMKQYPPRLKNWIKRQGGLPWHGWLTLDASTAVKHGIATYCEEEPQPARRNS